MVRDKFSISWGDTGTEPPDGDDFQSGERPDAQHFDWMWYNVIDKINAIWDEFSRLDSDDDGKVDAAETADYANDANATTYKGNDLDSDGDGDVDNADNVTSTYKGTDIDPDSDGLVEEYDESLVTEGESRELDASELSGSNGTAGQVLKTDGTSLSWSRPDTKQPVHFSLPHANFSPSITDVEIYRLSLQSGEQLRIDRLEIQLKGGGSNADVSIDVYDETNNTAIISDLTAGSVSSGDPIATSQTGVTITLRFTNNSGNEVDLSAQMSAQIVE